MKLPFLTLLLGFLVLTIGCSKQKTDPAEDAFKMKFEALSTGMTQAEVLKRLGEPTRTQSQIEEYGETIFSQSGPIELRKGDKVKVLVYSFGRRDYTLFFTDSETRSLLFMQTVLSLGDFVRAK